MSKFSKELKRLRESADLTQAQLANELKISRSTIGMYEQGKREPNFETLELIADYFNVDMSLFLKDGLSECDLYLQCYNKPAYFVVQKFLKLDSVDRGKIEERIDMLLESDKYKDRPPILLNA